MKHACIYCIVRFAPFAETEEFANVGIVLTAPAIRRMECMRLGIPSCATKPVATYAAAAPQSHLPAASADA